MNVEKFRLLLGFLVAPVVPALLIYLWSLLVSSDADAEWGGRVFLVFGYLAMIIFGVPIFALVNRKWRVENPAAYMAGGAIIGALLGAAIFVPDIVSNWHSKHNQSVYLIKSGLPIMGAACGFIAGGAFWLIAIKK
ncbi:MULTISPECIES: hypothetical protein [unclassified Pseudomonas]|uniref:hypothetical protein n=1 Tax=unclassified Pseudomonas TaxID=196821 RepID=UPI00117A9C72|nr:MULTISPECIES: hypothetical protein [unclassified Pseudomonas]